MIYLELKIEELRDQVTDLRRENAELRSRLDGCGCTHYRDACEYADSLIVDSQCRFGGQLTTLEWMLRTVVGASRRQVAIGDDLRAQLRALQNDN
jgi:hypothetical protein